MKIHTKSDIDLFIQLAKVDIDFKKLVKHNEPLLLDELAGKHDDLNNILGIKTNYEH